MKKLFGFVGFLAVLWLCFPVGSDASTLSWRDAPIVGTDVFNNGDGSLTVTVNGSSQIIPDSGALPSQSVIYINPTVWDGSSHFYDPASKAGAGSSVHVDTDSTYSYEFSWKFLGNGPISAYTAYSDSNTWSNSTFTTAELWSTIGGFWLEDVGNWQYTETWTGTGGNDRGASITSTRDFEVSSTPVPEPGTMMLLGIGLGGLALFGKRRMNKEA
jgi:hypothetical protein